MCALGCMGGEVNYCTQFTCPTTHSSAFCGVPAYLRDMEQLLLAKIRDDSLSPPGLTLYLRTHTQYVRIHIHDFCQNFWFGS